MNAVAELMRVGDPATSVAEYSQTAQALATLREKYTGARYDVATTAGMQSALEARRTIRGYRVALEKKRAEIKAPALERCKQIDSEARRITAALEALEDPIDAQIKVEEQRKENEKAAREHAERARVARNVEVIDDIRNLPLLSIGKSATAIAETLKLLRNDKPDVDDDFAVAADEALQKVLASLESMYAEKFGAELEAKRLADERAELDRRRAEDDARRAEDDRLAQIERDRLAAEERGRIMAEAAARREADGIERKRIDAERAEADRIAQAERDRIAAEQAAKQARIDVQQAELDRKRAEDAEAQRIRDEVAQAERDEAERQRVELDRERDAQEQSLRVAAREAAIAAAGIKFASVPNNWRALYNATNEALAAELIDIRHPIAFDLIVALEAIDDGEYVPMPLTAEIA